ncbi:MAG: tRNA 2-thiouridine(34) synthase MnmA, partial [Bacteroidia bacterium]|nr:tRNA 2-thiouridine(34) synthase MnmA [Bacteroidia bacterium]
QENGRYVISKGKDQHKDQSYVLWGISQANLKKTIFPLGKYVKKEVRKIAYDYGFKELANKSESYEICFIPENDYRGFLKNRVEGLEEKVAGGDFVLSDGTTVGKHKGYPFYTIGQRKGLEIAFGDPMYVTKIVPENNTVVIGPKEELKEHNMVVKGLNLIKYQSIDSELEVLTKIRYHDPGTMSTITQKGDEIHVKFLSPVNAVAPGQSAVFYEGDDILGGGIIHASN